MPDGGRRLRDVRANDAIRSFSHFGYELVAVKGSHHRLNRTGGPQLVLPVHHGRIKAGILLDAVKKAGITLEEFEKQL